MQQIILYLLTISGVTTFAIWIGKLLITKTFDLGLEKYKATLQIEIEEHKSSLSKISIEHQVKFSKLHEDRAEKIKILYAKVIELEKALIHSTSIFQGPEFVNDTVRDEACVEKIHDLINQLDMDRIYFSGETIAKFDSIIKESWDITFKMRKVRRDAAAIEHYSKRGKEVPQAYFSETDLWTEAEEKTQKEFKVLKEGLSNEFRSLLGI